MSDPTNRYLVGAALILIVLIAMVGFLIWAQPHRIVMDDDPQHYLHSSKS